MHHKNVEVNGTAEAVQLTQRRLFIGHRPHNQGAFRRASTHPTWLHNSLPRSARSGDTEGSSWANGRLRLR